MNKKIWVCLLGLLIVTSCQKVEQTKFIVGYVSKCNYNKLENEWTYFFCIGFPKFNPNVDDITGNYEFNEETTYVFDAYSFNREYIENSYVPVLGDDGKEISRFPVNIATLSTHINYRDDVKKISDYFNKQKFNSLITENDLKGLSVVNISKKILVDLFNKAILSKETVPGTYFEIPSASIEKRKMIDSSEVILKYYIDYGNIRDIYIDIENSDNSLKEKSKNSIDSTYEVSLMDNIKAIENKVIETGKFDVKKEFSKLNGEIYDKIFEILRYLEDYGKEEDFIK